ncbi:hypothetical protein D1007_08212 [Hordeum vulgare]|nr:hypothetical protein D1007_08212 [Hordeum vulgare]
MGGSDHAGADEAPEHIMKMGIDISVAVDDVSCEQYLNLDVVTIIVLPHPEPMVHIDSDYHSSVDSDSDGEPFVSYTHFCKDRSKLHEWFLSTALYQLEEITFNDGHMCSLIPFMLHLVPKLHIARSMNCHFPQINADLAILLSRRKHLEIVAVCIPNDDMKCLLCNVLLLSTFTFRRLMG